MKYDIEYSLPGRITITSETEDDCEKLFHDADASSLYDNAVKYGAEFEIDQTFCWCPVCDYPSDWCECGPEC